MQKFVNLKKVRSKGPGAIKGFVYLKKSSLAQQRLYFTPLLRLLTVPPLTCGRVKGGRLSLPYGSGESGTNAVMVAG